MIHLLQSKHFETITHSTGVWFICTLAGEKDYEKRFQKGTLRGTSLPGLE